MRFIKKQEEGNSDKENLHQGHRSRVKDDFYRNKIAEVNEHQVLEYLLFSVVPRKDTNETAHRLLNSFGNLANVCDADVVDLQKVEGITEHMANFLHMLPYIFRNYKLSKQQPKAILACTQDIYNYLGDAISHLPQEECYAICLDNGDHVINRKLVARGSITQVSIRANDVVRFATSVNASKVILVHNHPTTGADPSKDDVKTTRKLYFCLAFHDIELTEHLIVNYQGATYSFANDGWLSKFKAEGNRTLFNDDF